MKPFYDIGLLPCSKTKRRVAVEFPAGDLYGGSFTLKKHHANLYCSSFWILSAKHGLIPPSALISVYDTSIYDLTCAERHDLVSRVAKILPQLVGKSCCSYLSSAYESVLLDAILLSGLPVSIDSPYRGLSLFAFNKKISQEIRDAEHAAGSGSKQSTL